MAAPLDNNIHLDIAGVQFTLHVPSKKVCHTLQERYAAYRGTTPSTWCIHLRYNPSLRHSSRTWIEHEASVTRFQVEAFAGWMDFATHRAEVSTPSAELAHSAVERVMAYICMQELPRRHNALLLHGAGVVIGEQGYVFFGASGRGKSTVARLAGDMGLVLCDENVIVRVGDNGAELLGTPFWGTGTPTEKVSAAPSLTVPLHALFSLHHAPEFSLTPLRPASAAMELLASEKVATERVSSADAWLARVEQLVHTVPIYQLAFRPTTELWSFLDLEEKKGVSV